MNDRNAAGMLELAITRLFAGDNARAVVAGAPVEIRPYLQLFADLRAETIPPPSEAFRSALRTRLRGMARGEAPHASAVTPRLVRAAAAGVAALAFGSAFQPALARELVEQVRLTLGEAVADVVQTAINQVQPSANAESIDGSASAESGSRPKSAGPDPMPTLPDPNVPSSVVESGAPAPSDRGAASEASKPIQGPTAPRTTLVAPPGLGTSDSQEPGLITTGAGGILGATLPQPPFAGGEAPRATSDSPTASSPTGPQSMADPSIDATPVDDVPSTEPGQLGAEHGSGNQIPGSASATPPGQADNGNPGHSGDTPGNSPVSPPGQADNGNPGHSGDTPGNSPASPPGHTNNGNPGHSVDTPGNSPVSPAGQADNGNPGHSVDTPGNSPVSPPGQANNGNPGHS